MEKKSKKVPEQIGELASGLAKIIGEMDEKKGLKAQKIVKKKE